MRLAPETSLRFWTNQLSTLPARQVMAALRPEDRPVLLPLLSQLRAEGSSTTCTPPPTSPPMSVSRPW